MTKDDTRPELVCLGNGESRIGLDLDRIKSKYTVYGCNALYRDFTPDILFSIDRGMTIEIHESRYSRKNRVVTRRVTNSPYAVPFLINRKYSSGPSSVLWGCLEGYRKIYLIGHDLCNLEDGYINSVYKNTLNYHKADVKQGDIHDYFKNELLSIFSMAGGVSFIKVGPEDQERPERFNGLTNLSYMTTDEFMETTK